jgi:hypothetical protein
VVVGVVVATVVPGLGRAVPPPPQLISISSNNAAKALVDRDAIMVELKQV